MINDRLCTDYQLRWENRSSIRSRPRKIIDFEKPGFFFPENKQPLLLQRDLQTLLGAKKDEILLKTFKKYLSDIINLEIKFIASACQSILYENLIIPFNDKTKLNLYTILIDEYYHVYIAQDMLLQINQHFPELDNQLHYPISDADNAINTIKLSLPTHCHKIFEILAVCIFETTLVKELVEFFDSDDLNPSIKSYVNDHMNDESRHFGFFYNLLCDIWERLPSDHREPISNILGQFIHLYLNIESDKQFQFQLLCEYTQNKAYAHDVIEKLYAGFAISPDLPIVKNVLNVLKKAGILECKVVQSSFRDLNLSLPI